MPFIPTFVTLFQQALSADIADFPALVLTGLNGTCDVDLLAEHSVGEVVDELHLLAYATGEWLNG